jgi:hypothetical protein
VSLEKRNTPPWNKDKPEVASLFQNVSMDDYRVLMEASLKGKGEGMRILSLKTYENILTRKAFENRDPRGDLAAIVQNIESAL